MLTTRLAKHREPARTRAVAGVSIMRDTLKKMVVDIKLDQTGFKEIVPMYLAHAKDAMIKHMDQIILKGYNEALLSRYG